MRAKFPIVLSCSLLATQTVLAVPATSTLNLVTEAGFNKIELTFTPPVLPVGRDKTTLTGNVEVSLEIDPATNQVSELTILTGSVNGSAVKLSGSTFLVGSYNLTSSQLGAVLATPNPPGLVDPLTGNFDASQHTFTVVSGTLGGTISIPLLAINEVIAFDFSTTPVGGAGSGNGTVSLVETSSTPTSKSYTATVLMPINVSEVFEASGFMIPITAIGTAKMVGPVTIQLPPPNPYLVWTEASAIPGASFLDDANNDGVPNGLHWALGLTAVASPLPFLLQPVGDSETTVGFSVTLPAGGSAAPLSVLVTDDPESTPFTPLASEAVSAGNPIPAGTAGVVTIRLPKATKGFVRLAVDAPSP